MRVDDQMNQGMPGSVPPPPMGGETTPPAPPMNEGMAGEDPHEKILAALARIEERLVSIAAKVGA